VGDLAKVVREMAQIEVQNSNLGAEVWSKVLSSDALKKPVI